MYIYIHTYMRVYRQRQKQQYSGIHVPGSRIADHPRPPTAHNIPTRPCLCRRCVALNPVPPHATGDHDANNDANTKDRKRPSHTTQQLGRRAHQSLSCMILPKTAGRPKPRTRGEPTNSNEQPQAPDQSTPQRTVGKENRTRPCHSGGCREGPQLQGEGGRTAVISTFVYVSNYHSIDLYIHEKYMYIWRGSVVLGGEAAQVPINAGCFSKPACSANLQHDAINALCLVFQPWLLCHSCHPNSLTFKMECTFFRTSLRVCADYHISPWPAAVDAGPGHELLRHTDLLMHACGFGFRVESSGYCTWFKQTQGKSSYRIAVKDCGMAPALWHEQNISTLLPKATSCEFWHRLLGRWYN